MNLSLNRLKDQMRKNKKWGLGRWGKRGEGDRVGGGGGQGGSYQDGGLGEKRVV